LQRCRSATQVRKPELPRQPINICLHARPVGGELTRTKEAADLAWVGAADLEDYDIHPAIRLRITHGLSPAEPHVG
jgi:hypothetical protein